MKLSNDIQKTSFSDVFFSETSCSIFGTFIFRNVSHSSFKMLL